jgi:hypothetical protein
VGTLDLTNTGIITDSGALVVAGTTTLSSTSDITLDSASNNFNSVGISSAVNATIVDTNALVLSTSSISGNLSITAGNNLTQSGPLTIQGTSSFTAGAHLITLDNTSNNFTGAVSLSNSGAVNTVLYNNAPLILGTVSVGSGTPQITGIGGISQTGALIQASGAGTATLSAGAGSIILTNTATNFRGALILSNTGNHNIAINDATSLIFDTSSIGSGSLTVRVGLGGGTSNITQIGAITQEENAGATSFTTEVVGGIIQLNNSSNHFTGAVSLNTSTGTANTGTGAVTVVNNTALTLGQSYMGTGVFDITAAGTISEAGILKQAAGASAAKFTVSAVGSDILLHTYANEFTATPQFLPSSGSIVNLGFRNALSSANSSFPTLPTGLQNLTLYFDNAAMALPAITLSGTLSATANGLISQSGILNVSGSSTFSSGSANNITLNNVSNNFNNVGITSGNNVTLVDINGIGLAASTISGALNVTANGAVTNSGAVVVSGATTVAAGSAHDITLNNAANNFNSIAITTGNNVTLTDANAINLGTSTISGALTVNANGAITDSGTLTIANNATFTAGSSNNITLANLNNSYSQINILGANNVTISNTNNITLGQTTLSGNLSVTSNNGLITLNSDLSTNGSISLLGNALLNSASISAANGATFGRNNSDQITLGAATVAIGAVNNSINFNSIISGSQNLSVNAGSLGNITFNGNVARLGVVTIGNVNTITNNQLLNVVSYLQNAGGQTNFGSSGLNATSNVNISGTNVTGKVIVASLSLNTSFANLNGSVGGSIGEAAIQKITLTNTIGPGTHFFDGIDMYTDTTPASTSNQTSNSKNSSLIDTIRAQDQIANVLFPPINSIQQDDQNTMNANNITFEKPQIVKGSNSKGSNSKGSCLNIGNGIIICME